VALKDLVSSVPEISYFSQRVRDRVEIEGVYAPYVEQQKTALQSFLRDETLILPLDVDYDAIHGLSYEEKTILKATRPESIGQARRIEGVTPNAAVVLLAHIRRKNRVPSRAAIFRDERLAVEAAVSEAAK
jgi:tRNA U34 5-carboxymethylaminomethyl modifying enzyme MnmG/GidA